MKTAARVLELLLVVASIVYSSTITAKWVRAEKRVSYLEGQRDIADTCDNRDIGGLKKW